MGINVTVGRREEEIELYINRSDGEIIAVENGDFGNAIVLHASGKDSNISLFEVVNRNEEDCELFKGLLAITTN